MSETTETKPTETMSPEKKVVEEKEKVEKVEKVVKEAEESAQNGKQVNGQQKHADDDQEEKADDESKEEEKNQNTNGDDASSNGNHQEEKVNHVLPTECKIKRKSTGADATTEQDTEVASPKKAKLDEPAVEENGHTAETKA